MKERKNEWGLIKEIGKVKPLARGLDSEVHRVVNEKIGINMTAKEYSRWYFRSLSEKAQIEVLDRYYLDTEKAKNFLESNPNPCNQTMEINGVKYTLEYKVVSQAPIILENDSEEFHSGVPLQISVGQNFVDGLNLEDLESPNLALIKEKGISIKSQEIFVERFGFCATIENLSEDLFDELSFRLGVPYDFHRVNVKPFVDEEARKVIIFITDLVANLRTYFEYYRR